MTDDRIQPAPLENDSWHSRDTRRGQLVLDLAQYPFANYAFAIWAVVGLAIAIVFWQLAEKANFYLTDWAVLAVFVVWFAVWFLSMNVENEATDKRCPDCDYLQPEFCRYCPSCGHRYDPLELGTGALDADALANTHPDAGGVQDD